MIVPLLDRPLLLLPVHLVLLELLHPIVSLVFEADPEAGGLTSGPPRTLGSGLAGRTLWRPFSLGVTLVAGVIGTYLLTLRWGWPIGQARAFGFATLLLGQLVLLFVERSRHRPLWHWRAGE
jgi:Ca2+-transporting ATPase